MKFLFSCTSSNEHTSGDCDYAAVEIGPEEARNLLDKILTFEELKSRDKDVHEIYFWGDVAHSVKYFASLGEFEDNLPDGGLDYLLGRDAMAVSSIPDFKFERTECEQIVVNETGVKFFCYPRNVSIEITAGYFDKEDLMAIAEGFGEEHFEVFNIEKTSSKEDPSLD